MEVNHDLQQVRNQICNWVLITVSICGIPALIGSLLRSYTIGLQWVMGIQVVALTLVVSFVFFNRVIPYPLRAGYVVFLFTFIGLTGMAKFGIAAAAIPMAIVSPVLATILFGFRSGLVCAAITLIAMSGIAVGVINGNLANDFDLTAYAGLVPTWTAFLLVVVMSIAAPITAIIMLERHLSKALSLSHRSQEELEQLVKERTRALEQAKQGAEHLARTDVLTGLNNRRAFYEYATLLDIQARRQNQSYVILMLDVDHFKAINDNLGHDSGDLVLRMLGEILMDTFRSSDIVGRLGGEEFAVILPKTSMRTALLLANKLRIRIDQAKVHAPKGMIHVTVSIGIAHMDRATVTLEQVIANADSALYQAKQNGRNRVERFHSEAITLFHSGSPP